MLQLPAKKSVALNFCNICMCSHFNFFYRNLYESEHVYSGHTSYVTSVCMLPGDEAHPEGLVATGSRDTNILVFPLRGQQAVHTLTGHSDTGEGTLLWM